ncbi:hypothetical protein RvY_02748 [Ramazzottius varieornatus]|uniref:Uncharacterized protein n=1 Tax=Ramazzottius varieornatus TaxID=947166 RepID=A0A1D1UPJ9_RAMVA|nr:hypothetical protein RvY_02748 [Ramazzottius varieornatus]
MERINNKRRHDHDAFADFVTLVVPKVGLERAKWKYDIRSEQRKLTIFRLKYNEDDVATVADCLSLQFQSVASDSFDYSLNPSFSSGGQKKDPSYIEGLLGKRHLSSFVDIQNLLSYLEALDALPDNNEDVGSLEFDEPTYPLFERKRSFSSSIHSVENAEGQDSEGSYYEPKKRGKKSQRKIEDDIDVDSPPIPKKKTAATGQPKKDEKGVGEEAITPVKPRERKSRPATAEKKKVGRPRKEIKEDELKLLSKVSQSFGVGVTPAPIMAREKELRTLEKKGKGPGRPTKEEQLLKKKAAEELVEKAQSGFPALPAHPSSGGTIFSSQYWNTPAPSREKLNCAMGIHVDKDTIKNLPNVADAPVEEQLAQSVKYGWMLLEHLLGGSEAICRSFAYTSSGTSPIEKWELTTTVDKLLDGIMEHMRHSFSLETTDEVRKGIMVILRPKMEMKYSDQRGFRKRNQPKDLAPTRQPSDIFLLTHLEGCSYPKPGKVQVAHGFDFYIDEVKLKEIKDQFKDKEEPEKRRYGRFGMHLVAELVGGFDVYLKGAKQVGEGLGSLALIGDDIFEAIYLRTRKTFGVEDTLTMSQFRGFIRGYLERRKEIKVNEDTGLMASVLFRPIPSTSKWPPVGSIGPRDPPAVPGCNYWISPGPHRTRLAPSSEFYVDTTRLAEYQRYLGPECGKTTKGQHGKDWATYLKVLLQYAAGGEEQFLKRLLERRKAKQEGQVTAVLDDALVLAIFEHVTTLFKAPKNKQHLPECIENFSSRLLDLYDKGVTRWYFPGLDERPKPEGVSILEEMEYWRKPGPDRTQLRPGHDIYIRTKMLESIASYFGPGSKESDIKKYSFGVMMHMLGGPETSLKLWTGKYFLEGFRSMFVFDDLVAVCLHSDEVFHLMFSVSPTDSLIYAGVRMHRRDRHHNAMQKRIAKGAKLRYPRNSLHYALSES